MYKLVLIRHGESTWNLENRFTGWTDVDLTDTGVAQAKQAGQLLKADGYDFDVCYTSVLKRAIRTLWHTLDEMDRTWLPVQKCWQLNERHYGALQGLNKAETAKQYGDEQVLVWRRSYDTPPPPLEPNDPRSERGDVRYAKLAPPFLAATLLAAVLTPVAGIWMQHDSMSAAVTLGQLSAHALLLHGVLGYESLSAGAWYVAIDFQLYMLTVSLLWLGGRLAGQRRMGWLMPLAVTVGIVFSLLYFNLDADWDNWAPYFFGSYGLGLMAWWASDPARTPRAMTALMAMAAVPVLLALAIDYRSRIALALLVACALFLFGRARTPAQGGAWRIGNTLGGISYAVFLVHFPICMVINGLFDKYAPHIPAIQFFGIIIAWLASTAGGALFYYQVECRAQRLLAPKSCA